MNSTLEFAFPSVRNKSVTARFDGGDLSSDAGVVLLAEAEKNAGIIHALANAIVDTRQFNKVKHSLEDLVSARVLGICCGYEDANDLDSLRNDPAFKLACDHLPATGSALASQPSISRLENRIGAKDLVRAAYAIARAAIAQLPADTTHVILDVDATPDPCHGQQEFEGFNAHNDTHCYLQPLLQITAAYGQKRLISAVLRPGKASAWQGLY